MIVAPILNQNSPSVQFNSISNPLVNPYRTPTFNDISPRGGIPTEGVVTTSSHHNLRVALGLVLVALREVDLLSNSLSFS